MNIYYSKSNQFSGTDYHEIHKKALITYKKIKSRSKRKPYIRSSYFKREKVFLELFWLHLNQKNWRDRNRRLKLFNPAIELVCFSRCAPISKVNPNKSTELLHRFTGMTPKGQCFYVQIKQEKSGRKWLMSIFPETKGQKKKTSR